MAGIICLTRTCACGRAQELLEGFDGEAAEGVRGGQAPLLAWVSGLARKGRPEEDLDEETLRVRLFLTDPHAHKHCCA